MLEAVAPRHGLALRFEEGLVGGAAIDAHGVAIRPEELARAGAADAVLLGAVGGPRWDDPAATVRPEQALFALRARPRRSTRTSGRCAPCPALERRVAAPRGPSSPASTSSSCAS